MRPADLWERLSALDDHAAAVDRGFERSCADALADERAWRLELESRIASIDPGGETTTSDRVNGW